MESLYFLLIIFFGNHFASNKVEGLKAEKIIGGREIWSYDMTYVVSLMYLLHEGDLPPQIVCAGALISSKYVVTVAHCFLDENGQFINKEFIVVISELNLLGTISPDLYVRVELVMIPDYYDFHAADTYSKRGNLAILKLAEQLPTFIRNRHIKKVKIARRLYRSADDFTVSGYGWNNIEVIKDPRNGKITEINGASDGRLRYAHADILDDFVCQKHIIGDLMADGNLCIKVRQLPNEHKGICQGDSGAPLVRGEFLSGLAIHGFAECNENQKPGIYINIPSYSEYILAVMDGSRQNTRTFELTEREPNVFEFIEIIP